MPRVLIDTDVLIDVLSRREPHVLASAQIFSLSESQKIEGYITPLSISNISYILRKEEESHVKRLLTALTKIFKVSEILPIDIQNGLRSGFKDIEDSFQNATALRLGCEVLITRNVKDYEKSTLKVFTPSEFLPIYFPKIL